jgi:hypothetical protein
MLPPNGSSFNIQEITICLVDIDCLAIRERVYRTGAYQMSRHEQ